VLIKSRKEIFSEKAFSLNSHMSQDQKKDAIIEAALKRFAHFGVAKTTMNEIAHDLAISKASLYYYFPDKISLYAEVLKSIIEREAEKESKDLQKDKDPIKTVLHFLEKRTEFIIKYYNIVEFLKVGSPGLPVELQPLFTHIREKEIKRIASIIDSGKMLNIFNVKSSKSIAELYYDCLEGYRYTILSRHTQFFPDKQQFQDILKKEKEFSVIFFNGLTQ
jgi:TetR/AcrR family transcriptional repressor of mexJK operon